MTQPEATGETRLRVRYAETDQMGVVYHSNYLIWFEVGRAELMRQLGLDYKALEREENCGIAVVEVTCRYKCPARYDDEILVRTRITAVRGPVVKFAYQVLRAADEKLLCEGTTVHVTVDLDMKKRNLPEKYAERFRQCGVESLPLAPS
jgi:acyl-CoA thioester hydrolase